MNKAIRYFIAWLLSLLLFFAITYREKKFFEDLYSEIAWSLWYSPVFLDDFFSQKLYLYRETKLFQLV